MSRSNFVRKKISIYNGWSFDISRVEDPELQIPHITPPHPFSFDAASLVDTPRAVAGFAVYTAVLVKDMMFKRVVGERSRWWLWARLILQ